MSGRRPRTEPLLVSVIAQGDVDRILAFLNRHGGTMQTFSDETHALYFPIGTQEELQEGNSKRANYVLYFPDGAEAGWFHRVVAEHAGPPDKIETGFVVPSETEPH